MICLLQVGFRKKVLVVPLVANSLSTCCFAIWGYCNSGLALLFSYCVCADVVWLLSASKHIGLATVIAPCQWASHLRVAYQNIEEGIQMSKPTTQIPPPQPR